MNSPIDELLSTAETEVPTRAERRAAKKPWTRTRKIVVWSTSSILAILLIGIAIAGSYVASLADTYNSNVTVLPSADTFPKEESRPPQATDGSRNILLLGSDSRGDATIAGEDTGSNQRSDVLMLVNIAANRKDVTVMSIMRDLWVPIPGHGNAKINAALAWGGTPLVVETVESLLGVRIDNLAIIDFEGFRGMTDALGGVDVNVETGFTRKDENMTFPQGMNHLDGVHALGFVRERYAFPTGDFQRVRNQQLYLQALGSALLSKDTLTDPTKISNFVTETSKFLSVDSGFDFPTMVELGLSLRDLRAENIHYFTMPTAGTGWSPDHKQSIVNLNTAAIPALREAIARDTVADYAAKVVAGTAPGIVPAK
ncbi:LCP family protein [Mycetocola saprophilus]|uniref:LCP family protein n=1 Tax=Mycetocola saprophilus TaxID=76636 RepID=UPI003BF34716